MASQCSPLTDDQRSLAHNSSMPSFKKEVVQTSDSNKAILEQANAAVSQGDYEGFLAHCTDDVEWTFVGMTDMLRSASLGSTHAIDPFTTLGAMQYDGMMKSILQLSYSALLSSRSYMEAV